MKIFVNGRQTDIEGPVTVSRLLTLQEVKMPQMVSVELNGQILRPGQFESTLVTEGDNVEFIYFMGGGRWT